MNSFVFMTNSYCIDCGLWIWYNSRCTSSMVTQSLQSNVAASIVALHFVHDIGPSELHFFINFTLISSRLCKVLHFVCMYMVRQRDAFTWAHDHRVHHKYSETDAGEYIQPIHSINPPPVSFSLLFYSIIDEFSNFQYQIHTMCVEVSSLHILAGYF